MLEVVIERDRIRIGERFSVSFQRTLRIPDDGRAYPLPPGLGAFPVYRISDAGDRVPSAWRERGGAFIPMYQREALWLGFSAASWKPNAVKVTLGGVNALSGRPDRPGLGAEPQDYLVCPDQPWLDGFNAEYGSIRQFVAMTLGLGYTIESSIMGEERHGGMEITVYEPKPGIFPDVPPVKTAPGLQRLALPRAGGREEMGLGAGGVMRQRIYPDPYGVETWDLENRGGILVHILNSECFEAITGHKPPPSPIDAAAYTRCGLPWFDLYDEEKGDIAPSAELASARTVSQRERELGEETEKDASVEIRDGQVRKLGHGGPRGRE
ncbi:MAG: hypothetical protein HGA84_07260 [Syntrophobacteraceae bacterium]|nr:hypothetical protein [Syntrophobacteraceae bacterium]